MGTLQLLGRPIKNPKEVWKIWIKISGEASERSSVPRKAHGVLGENQ